MTQTATTANSLDAKRAVVREMFDRADVLLSPMAGVSDRAFREICREHGADVVYCEFVSADGVLHGNAATFDLMEVSPTEHPVGIQLFGSEPATLAEAARTAERIGPDLIDLNFGCPVKKVVCKDGGAGILRDLPKMRAITEAVVEAATRPVTVKTRLGWNDDSIRIVEVARMLEEVGVQALAVHARTRSQMYRGEARWEWLRRIKEEAGLTIPLIGNGDATTPEKIERMFDVTGVDAVMIGRGAIGNPWIFRDAKVYRETGEVLPPPSWEERVSVVAEHLSLKCDWLGERVGVLEMRRMYGGYFKGFRNASALRQRIMEEDTKAGVLEVLLNFDIEDDSVRVAVSGVAKPLSHAVMAKLPRPVSARQAV